VSAEAAPELVGGIVGSGVAWQPARARTTATTTQPRRPRVAGREGILLPGREGQNAAMPRGSRRRADAEPRPESLSVLFDLFTANQRVRALLADAMADSPLRPDEYAVYSALVDYGPLPPKGLATVLGMPPTTMSHYVASMRERGHVTSERNAADRRSFLLALTPDGRKVHGVAARAFAQGNDRRLRALSVPAADVRRALQDLEAAAAAARSQLAADAVNKVG
jgi:DNA-binding MarR family transcriptional regulator